MLHALGITHVVSVGACVFVPHRFTPQPLSSTPTPTICLPRASLSPVKKPGGHGSLWIEEREDHIKVLDIKGVCNDGIDTLETQLEPICDWIDRARAEGGKVLVHCRVGVSRSSIIVTHETPQPPSHWCIPHCSLSMFLGSNSTPHAITLQPSQMGSQACKGTHNCSMSCRDV